MNDDIIERVDNKLKEELFKKHLLSAFVILIDMNFEIYFSYKNISYRVKKEEKNIVLLSSNNMKKIFNDATDLTLHAKINSKELWEVWDEIILDSI